MQRTCVHTAQRWCHGNAEYPVRSPLGLPVAGRIIKRPYITVNTPTCAHLITMHHVVIYHYIVIVYHSWSHVPQPILASAVPGRGSGCRVILDCLYALVIELRSTSRASPSCVRCSLTYRQILYWGHMLAWAFHNTPAAQLCYATSMLLLNSMTHYSSDTTGRHYLRGLLKVSQLCVGVAYGAQDVHISAAVLQI